MVGVGWGWWGQGVCCGGEGQGVGMVGGKGDRVEFLGAIR